MAGTKNGVLIGKNADFTQVDGPNAQSGEINGLVTNGQLWIGSTALNAGGTHINVGSLTSPSGTVTISYSSPNIVLSASGTVGQTITGNTGGARPPSSGNWNLLTANSTPLFVGSGSTITLDFGTSSNLGLGSEFPSLTSGVSNTALGLDALNSVTSGQGNTAVGAGCMDSLNTGLRNTGLGAGAASGILGGVDNVAIGEQALFTASTASFCVAVGSDALGNANQNGLTAVGLAALNAITSGIEACAFGYQALTLATGSGNSAFGYASMFQLTTGANNTAYGKGSGANFLTGSTNLFLGYNTGNNYVGAESSNILLQNLGTAAESNTIRIGTQGSGAGQQLQTHIAGVINTVSGRVVKTTVPGAYPYLTLSTDYIILVDTASARTINLIASPVTGTTYRIKDNVGTAAANNITVTPNAGTIDGSASFTMNVNWESLDIVYQGTSWRIL